MVVAIAFSDIVTNEPFTDTTDAPTLNPRRGEALRIGIAGIRPVVEEECVTCNIGEPRVEKPETVTLVSEGTSKKVCCLVKSVKRLPSFFPETLYDGFTFPGLLPPQYLVERSSLHRLRGLGGLCVCPISRRPPAIDPPSLFSFCPQKTVVPEAVQRLGKKT